MEEKYYTHKLTTCLFLFKKWIYERIFIKTTNVNITLSIILKLTFTKTNRNFFLLLFYYFIR